MTSNLTRFNNIVDQFIDQLIQTYNDNNYFSNEFKIFKEKFKLIRKINPAKSIEAFLLYGYTHKDKIMNEDENFFLKYDCSSHIENEHSLMNSLKLKELWKNENSDEIKKSIFQYFKVFIVLTEKYLEAKINIPENK